MGERTAPEQTAGPGHLGVAAGLGLPLPQEFQPRAYSLPMNAREVGESVPLPGLNLPNDVALTVATTQAGRLRLTTLVQEVLDWQPGQALRIERRGIPLASSRTVVPCLLLRPARRSEPSDAQLNSEQRLTLGTADRLALGLDAHGSAVLAVVRREHPSELLLIGERSIGAVLLERWPHAR